MDVLDISKGKSELLDVDLQNGRASNVIVGQIQRYMGFVQYELVEVNQPVKGVISGKHWCTCGDNRPHFSHARGHQFESCIAHHYSS